VLDIFVETKGKEESWGKSESEKGKRNSGKDGNSNAIMWKKRSVLFNFPYREICAHIKSR
jgi:hypothetical protein